MADRLHIGSHSVGSFFLPVDAQTQTFGVIAKRGAGKTYTALVMVEEMLRVGLRVVVADPVGVCWGLRAGADGRHAGLPIVVLGGDHGDVPLEATAGELIADFVVDERQSAVLDLSGFRKAEQVRFMTDFAERLYHRNREPLHLVLDEADAFAPQRPMHGQERMLGAVEDLVRRGRARGIGVTLVTQRAAVLNKDVLTQVEVLVALRTIAPQDRDAVDAWVKVHGTAERRQEFLDSLASLPIGKAWFWSPGWLDVFRLVTVRARHTFDSSATPTAGKSKAAPKALAAVDLTALRTRIAATIERAKANDPTALRRALAEERKLRATQASHFEKQLAAALKPGGSKHAAWPKAAAAKLEGLAARADAWMRRAEDHVAHVRSAIEDARVLATTLRRAAAESAPAVVRIASHHSELGVKALEDFMDAEAGAHRVRVISNGRGDYAGRVVSTLSILMARGIPASQTTVAAWLRVHRNNGSLGTTLAAMRARGILDGWTLRIPARSVPSGAEYIMGLLDGYEQRIVKVVTKLVSDHGAAVRHELLSETLGVHRNNGSLGTALAQLRAMGLVTPRGPIALTDAFHV